MWFELVCADSVASGAFGHRHINDKEIPVNIVDLATPVRFNPNRKYGFDEGNKGPRIDHCSGTHSAVLEKTEARTARSLAEAWLVLTCRQTLP